MSRQQLVAPFGQEARAVVGGELAVQRMARKELGLLLQAALDRLVGVDVLLAAVDDADEAEAQRVRAAGQNVECVGAAVHEVELGQHADRARSVGVDLVRELDGVRRGNVLVGRLHGEDDGVLLLDERQHHVAYLRLDVARLVAHRHTRDAGRVDQRERQHVGRVDAQDDRVGRHGLGLTRHSVGLLCVGFDHNHMHSQQSG